MSNCSKIYSNSEKSFYQALKNNYDAYSQYKGQNFDWKASKIFRDKAIKMSYAEYMSGEKEHDYSNLYSCVYDFKKKNNVLESIEELMQLMKDIDFNVINKKCAIHNFKVINHIPLN